MKGSVGGNATKLLLFPSPSPAATKPYGAGAVPALLTPRRRLLLIVLLSFFTCASLLALLSTARNPSGGSRALCGDGGGSGGGIPKHVFDTLVEYYAASANFSMTMPADDARAIAAVLRRRVPCNLLVFGLGGEAPLWRALNAGGRTVFLDDNQFYVAHMEEKHPGLEAYDVAYATSVAELPQLLSAARSARGGACRPVQNLLFSECRLAINDLPNEIYDVPWDVILVDGPSGYSPESPGRAAAIFTAAVLARSRMIAGGGGAVAAAEATTDVLVHDFQRELETACGREFLCEENHVAETSSLDLAHYAVAPAAGDRRRSREFCSNGDVGVKA